MIDFSFFNTMSSHYKPIYILYIWPPAWVTVLQCSARSHQAEGALSPEGKKIPTRGRGGSRRKQVEAQLLGTT